jgi:hypothetical protein
MKPIYQLEQSVITITPEKLTKIRRIIENRLKRNPFLVVDVARFLKIELPK